MRRALLVLSLLPALAAAAMYAQGIAPAASAGSPGTLSASAPIMLGAPTPEPTATAGPTAVPSPAVAPTADAAASGTTAVPTPDDAPAPFYTVNGANCFIGWRLDAAGICHPPTRPLVLWSAADCAWALPEMRLDADLDAAEARAIRDGSDTRYPGQADYYDHWAGEWNGVVAELTRGCASPPVAPSPSECAVTQSDLSVAIAVHTSDEASTPAYAGWDERWIASYSRLRGMYRQVCP